MESFLNHVLEKFVDLHSSSVIEAAVAAADTELNEQCEKYSARNYGHRSLLQDDGGGNNSMASPFRAFRDSWLVPALCRLSPLGHFVVPNLAPRPPEAFERTPREAAGKLSCQG